MLILGLLMAVPEDVVTGKEYEGSPVEEQHISEEDMNVIKHMEILELMEIAEQLQLLREMDILLEDDPNAKEN